MSDTISLNNMHFFAKHGVLSAEKELGQNFIVSVHIGTNLQKAGQSDELNDTVDYAQVYQITKSIVERKHFNLIEALAENIAQALIASDERIASARIIIKKPNAPVAGVFDNMEVNIIRYKPNLNKTSHPVVQNI